MFAPMNPRAWADLFGTGPSFGSGFIHPGLIIGVEVAIVAFRPLAGVATLVNPTSRVASSASGTDPKSLPWRDDDVMVPVVGRPGRSYPAAIFSSGRASGLPGEHDALDQEANQKYGDGEPQKRYSTGAAAHILSLARIQRVEGPKQVDAACADQQSAADIRLRSTIGATPECRDRQTQANQGTNDDQQKDQRGRQAEGHPKEDPEGKTGDRRPIR